jgi:hypothetical protein
MMKKWMDHLVSLSARLYLPTSGLRVCRPAGLPASAGLPGRAVGGSAGSAGLPGRVVGGRSVHD